MLRFGFRLPHLPRRQAVTRVLIILALASPSSAFAQPIWLQEQIALCLIDAAQVAAVREDVLVQGTATPSTIGKSTLPLSSQPIIVQTVTGAFLRTFAINDLVEALQQVNNVNAYTQYGVYEYYTVLNAAAGYRRGPFQYGLSVTNLANADYWASTLGNSQFYPGEPRRIMGTVRVWLD